jgi:hypothetical protein
MGANTVSRRSMTRLVAIGTESDQVFLYVVTLSAARVDMVDLQLSWATTYLAAPPIPGQNPLVQFLVGFRFEPQPGSLWSCLLHDAFATWVRNCCLCVLGRRLTSRIKEINRSSGFPLSRFAPARKSYSSGEPIFPR